MTFAEYILYSIGGVVVFGPIYLLFFGGLEWLIKRDEGSEPPVNSFRASQDRIKRME